MNIPSFVYLLCAVFSVLCGIFAITPKGHYLIMYLQNIKKDNLNKWDIKKIKRITMHYFLAIAILFTTTFLLKDPTSNTNEYILNVGVILVTFVYFKQREKPKE